jgi:N-acetylglucosamine kinase-like BadF-type ATPase
MKYYLGIDGGGTKTKVCLMDESMTIIGFGNGGPSSIDTVDRKTTLKSIRNALLELNPDLIDLTHIDGIFAGLGGVVTENDKLALQELLRDLPYTDDSTLIKVENDVINALASGEKGDYGMVLIVGTGMVAYGRNQDGITHKAGGWGYKEGDAGSSYDLGYQSIKTVIRAFDKRIPSSGFTDAVAESLGMREPKDIVAIMDKLWGHRTNIASLAPLVTEYANQGDSNAMTIIDVATDELALCVKAVYQNIDLPHSHLVVVGSLGNAQGYFKSQLHEKIHAIDSKIEIVPPAIDPAFAAAIIALRNSVI